MARYAVALVLCALFLACEGQAVSQPLQTETGTETPISVVMLDVVATMDGESTPPATIGLEGTGGSGHISRGLKDGRKLVASIGAIVRDGVVEVSAELGDEPIEFDHETATPLQPGEALELRGTGELEGVDVKIVLAGVRELPAVAHAD